MAAERQGEGGADAAGKLPAPLQFALTARNGTTLQGHLLAEADLVPLQRFNANLSDRTRSFFLPHAYDMATLARYAARNRSGKDRAFVLYRRDELVGYFFLWDFDQPAPVLGIGLADAWQGQGLGEPMLRLLIDEARSAGCDAIELTTVLKNELAFRLYRRIGFELLGEVDNVAGDGRTVRERRMLLALKPGVRPAARSFKPPLTLGAK
jgi:RimJ/RimL family protein N-acetyltransferase